MHQLLSNEFLLSIVVIDDFKLCRKNLLIDVICIESNIDVSYCLKLNGVVAFIFRQEDEDPFDVIDVFLEPVNDCPYLDFMKSESKKEYLALRFHSGTHHLVVGFKDVEISKK